MEDDERHKTAEVSLRRVRQHLLMTASGEKMDEIKIIVNRTMLNGFFTVVA